tara:strand:- start:4424 stop:4972 length:549 start_codon:yes stop_codon:yes gene_type:complete
MKLYEVVSLIIGGVVVAWVGYGAFFESNISTPPFKSLKRISGIEIREYEKILLVSHPMSSENRSFRQLFRYIDGGNDSSQKIPMTAPVIENNGYMMFVMPKSMSEAPQPMNKELQIKSIKNLKVAVKSFRGSSSAALKVREKLIKKLNQLDVNITGEWYLCQYNSPWVFPLLRKNEIWVEIN